MSRAQITTPRDVLAYITAGKAKVTLVSLKTGNRFTFKVEKPNGEPNPRYKPREVRFVALLSGPNNETDYQYLGQIYPEELTAIIGRCDDGTRPSARKSRISVDAPSAKAFNWFWDHITQGDIPETLEVWHEGTCGRCGRALTDPESIARGIGPVCANA